MKKFLVILAGAFLILCSSIFCVACNTGNKEVVKDGIHYEKWIYSHEGNEEEVYAVVGCDSNVTVLNIPEEINGLPVRNIKNSAFRYNEKLMEIIIPKTITINTMYWCPFLGCTNIEKITSPSCDITYLFTGSGSSDLTGSETIPDSVKYLYLTNDCTEIRSRSLYNCSNIRELHIPKSVTKITDGTTGTSIGVNGNSPSLGKFSGLPFGGCENLTIYCEAESKPSGWGEYWNYIDSERSAPVHWGSY